MPPKRMSAKATAAAMLASAPSMEDVISGAIRIPDEILQSYEIENDLPIEQQAYYPSSMDTDTSSSSTPSNGEDVGGGNHDENRPPFSVRDAILGEDCAFDEIIHTSSEFFSSTMHFVPGKHFWPVYRRSEWKGKDKLHCRYEGYELDDGCEIIMHPEEWIPEPNESFKFWGVWCSEACWRTWLKTESQCANEGHCILAQRRTAIVTMREEEASEYMAPIKHGLLKGWGGKMDIKTYRSISKPNSSVPRHTDRLITNGRFIPTPVVRQIDIFNRQLASSHYQCADDFYQMGHVTEQEREQLLETMPQHASIKVVESGVWFDDSTKTWMDAHNATSLEGNGHCFTPAK